MESSGLMSFQSLSFLWKERRETGRDGEREGRKEEREGGRERRRENKAYSMVSFT